jgi:alkanesulfonate monooxygenase SsuD/methylene tetrahydromethanopterin reductase-like flavin-dependent oxidoreductase (luciferase family)
MTRLVGEVADGMFTHGSNSDRRTLTEVTIPAVQQGLKKAGRPLDAVHLAVAGHVNTGPTREDVQRSLDEQRRGLAVMFSTPNYWNTLELHGWDDLGPRLRALTREGRWSELPEHITDEMLETIVPTGTYDEIAPIIREWYGDLPVSIRFPLPDNPADDKRAAKVIAELQA